MKRDNNLDELYKTMVVLPNWKMACGSIVKTIEMNMNRYVPVSIETGVPYPVIAAIHWLEGSGNFNTHLHNGDSLARKTVNVPARRPLVGNPPYKWEVSAIDALRYDKLDKHPWMQSLTDDLLEIEFFNGAGYRNRKLNSPYLWSGTQHYDKGKYIKDGVFSYNAVSKQLGAAAILNGLGWWC